MGTREFFGHTNPDGVGPNRQLREAGVLLPSFYGTADDANNVESILAGHSTFEAAFAAWLDSAPHRAHLLAETAFFEEQTSFGVGYAFVPGSPFQHYYVFVSVPPA